MTVVIVLALAWSVAGAERYLSAVVDEAGNLRIVTADGRTVTIQKQQDEIGFDKIAVSLDGTAVGWVGMQENCCTSYPIPTRLVVHFAGQSLRFVGNDLPVWNWRFIDGGKRVALHQETVHGGLGEHYEVRDVATGRLVAEWSPKYGRDNQRLPNQRPPSWVGDLRAQ